jgi:hypothetical protein
MAVVIGVTMYYFSHEFRVLKLIRLPIVFQTAFLIQLTPHVRMRDRLRFDFYN